MECTHSACDRVEKYLELFSKNNVIGEGNSPDDVNRALLLKHASLIEEFEEEKRQMRMSFEREKHSLKKAFENERKDYNLELDTLRNGTVGFLGELEGKYEKEIDLRLSLQREKFEEERIVLRRSIQEQMNLMADVENEIKRILKRLIVELKRFNQSTCEKLQSDLCKTNFIMNTACLTWLKEIFSESNGVSEQLHESKNTFCICQNLEKEQQTEKDELQEVGQAFRKQKKELTEIFLKEKKHLEEEIEQDCLKHKKKLDKEYEERVQAETQVWQETIKEYEREIAILRYERQQMDHNYCLEIDRLKLETEKEKVDICTKYMKEKEQLRRKLSNPINDSMFKENGPTTKAGVKGFHVSKQKLKTGGSRKDDH